MAEWDDRPETAMPGMSIWNHFYTEFTRGSGYWMDENGRYIYDRSQWRLLSPEDAERVADKIAADYGATRTKGTWG